MLLTAHALTGITLGTIIEMDLGLFPAAIGSHFILDAMPHFGIKGLDFRSRKGFIIGSIDFAGALTVLVVAVMIAPEKAGHSIIGWLGATLPDLFYLPEIFFGAKVFPQIKRFHSWIQWGESFPGTIVDIIWASAMTLILHARL